MMWAFLPLFLAILGIIVLTSRWKWHPFLALIVVSIGFGWAVGMPRCRGDRKKIAAENPDGSYSFGAGPGEFGEAAQDCNCRCSISPKVTRSNH